jgi:hypothetical protein
LATCYLPYVIQVYTISTCYFYKIVCVTPIFSPINFLCLLFLCFSKNQFLYLRAYLVFYFVSCRQIIILQTQDTTGSNIIACLFLAFYKKTTNGHLRQISNQVQNSRISNWKYMCLVQDHTGCRRATFELP